MTDRLESDVPDTESVRERIRAIIARIASIDLPTLTEDAVFAEQPGARLGARFELTAAA